MSVAEHARQLASAALAERGPMPPELIAEVSRLVRPSLPGGDPDEGAHRADRGLVVLTTR